jgi:hypothetical protein
VSRVAHGFHRLDRPSQLLRESVQRRLQKLRVDEGLETESIVQAQRP